MKTLNGSNSRMMTGNNNAAAKKLVIKPFSVAPKVSDNFFAETWQKLKQAVKTVYEKNASSIGKEELYRSVEDLCAEKYSQKLYDDLSAELLGHVVRKVESLLNHTGDSADFLVFVDSVWTDHCEQLGTIRNIFLRLDRVYAAKTNGAVRTIWDLGSSFFRTRLDQLPEIVVKVICAVVDAVDTLRSGDNTMAEVVGRVSHMLLTLELYATHFEPTFLSRAKDFYSAEGIAAITALDTPRFLALIDRRLSEASDLTTRLLDVRTRRALFDVIECALLRPHVQTVMEKGFKQLVDEDRRDDLRRLYLLLKRIDCVDSALKGGWSVYIRLVGESIIADLAAATATANAPPAAAANGALTPAAISAVAAAGERDKSFVEDVLLLLEKLEVILRQSFDHKESLALALKMSFEHFLNLNQKVTAEQLARYVDRKMRGEKGVTEQEVEAKLDSVMRVFKFLMEKDIFEAFYKKHLSKRLLLGKSASADLEKSMLAKLKAECGPAFTAKLDGMFTDIDLSKQCQTTFAAHTARTSTPSSSSARVRDDVTGFEYPEPEFEVQLLTAGNWPTVNDPSAATMKLPAELVVLRDRFESFYHSAFQGRKLVWTHLLERCVVSAFFPKGRKTLEVSLFQALVLRCFNGATAPRLSLADVRERTGIETDELRRTLQSLACGMIGTRVLTKDPKGKDVEDSDHFVFNADFTNKLNRIKINTIQAKENNVEDIQKTLDEVAKDRTYQMDAVVVRVMKSRKRLSHALLISEVMAQLRFPAGNADIKKRIESLIERDYLERDPDDNAFYKYLA